MNNKCTISIIIVNWNAGNQLVDCIESIEKYNDNLVKTVIIVDNSSTDNSIQQVRNIKNLSFKLEFIFNQINLGFGAACNQGADLASTEFLLFLNPDTKLFNNSLIVPYNFMNDSKNNDVAVTGIQLVDEQMDIAKSCSRFPSITILLAQIFGINRLPKYKRLTQSMIEWAHNTSQNVDQVMGAFFMVRNSLFKSMGKFDERFFVYFEEVDFSLRVYQAGYRSVYLAEAQAYHAGGGTSNQVKAHRLFYSLRSRLLYGFKNFNCYQAWLLVFVTLIIEPITRLLLSIYKCDITSLNNIFKAYKMLWLDMTNIIKCNV